MTNTRPLPWNSGRVTMIAVPSKPSTMRDILAQRCPRCRQGKIFRGSVFLGFPKMYERCPACDLKFEREAG